MDKSTTTQRKALFIHQNFPAQFKYLAPALAKKGWSVAAFAQRVTERSQFPGVTVIPYTFLNSPAEKVHPLLSDHEAKVLRGEAVAALARTLKAKGYYPDVIYAHPGWGEALFLKDVWPDAKLVVYCEYYYNLEGQDVNYDPEFGELTFEQQCRLKLKNTVSLHALQEADAAISPTRWQRQTYPKSLQRKIQVIHDGIDLRKLKETAPQPLTFPDSGKVLTADDKIVTFISRDLDPVRGFHSFMRALPEILRKVPDAHVLILGGDGHGYGQPHESGQCWRRVMLDEVKGQIDLGRVHFLGWVPYSVYANVLKLSKAHLYLSYPFVPSWSLLEAMAADVPLVVSNTASIHEFVGKSIPSVDFFSAADIARETISLLEGDRSKNRLQPRLSKRIAASIDLELCLEKQQTVLDQLMS